MKLEHIGPTEDTPVVRVELSRLEVQLVTHALAKTNLKEMQDAGISFKSIGYPNVLDKLYQGFAGILK